MNAQIKVSVVVPVYNLQNELKKCVSSIEKQTHSNIEIILVNDGSTDKSWDVICHLAEKDNRIIPINKENGGVTSARLAGVQKASGEYIGFVDGDDEIEKDMYEILLDNAVKYRADISHCGYQISFRSVSDAKACYRRFDRIICVSQTVKQNFLQVLQIPVPHEVLYNTNESDKIIRLSQEEVDQGMMDTDEIKLVGVGKLLKSKGFDRVARIVKQLKEQKYPVHFYVLGEGPERNSLQEYIQQNGLERNITLLGYQLNPYKYVAKCDLFICASFAEGFSTAATETLIVGTPVCTVEVSGMKEMLGQNNEYGLVVENNDEALYQGIKRFFEEPGLLEHYTKQAEIRGKDFSTEKTVSKVEKMLLQLCEE